MNTDEQRIAIAVSLGARVKRKKFPRYKRNSTGERWEWKDGTSCAHPGGGFFGWGWNQQASVSELPDYPSDLNAAVTLCNAMAATGLFTLIEGTAIRWTCSLYSDDFCIQHTATGATLSAAICEAYLRASWLWEEA